MISCLISGKDEALIRQMCKKRDKLQLQAKGNPDQEARYYSHREQMILFVFKKFKPALDARIQTWVVRNYCNQPDAESLVYEHVIMAVDKFKPERGNCKFSSFLWTLSNRAFSNFISASRRQKRDPQSASLAISDEEVLVPLDITASTIDSVRERLLVSLDESSPYGNEGNSVSTLADTVPDPSQLDDSLNFSMILELVDSHCTEQQRVLLSLLQQNYTYKEIAKRVGTTAGTVSRQIQQLRKKLRHELQDNRYFA